MPRKGRRSSRNGRRRAASGYHCGDEFLTFSIKLGASQNITLLNISTRPKDCNIRIMSITVSAAQPVVPGPNNDQTSGYFTAGALDVQLYDNTTVCSTSRPQVLGANPRSIWARMPRGKGYIPYNASTALNIAQINAICLGRASLQNNDVFIRGLIHIRYSFSFEVLIATCPVHLCDTDNTDNSPSTSSDASSSTPSSFLELEVGMDALNLDSV
jgi:hypothetical protein